MAKYYNLTSNDLDEVASLIKRNMQVDNYNTVFDKETVVIPYNTNSGSLYDIKNKKVRKLATRLATNFDEITIISAKSSEKSEVSLQFIFVKNRANQKYLFKTSVVKKGMNGIASKLGTYGWVMGLFTVTALPVEFILISGIKMVVDGPSWHAMKKYKKIVKKFLNNK